MKQLEFNFTCSLPANPFSVEQEHVTLKQIMEGNFTSGSPRLDYSDSEDEDEDDYDEMCRGTYDLDAGFEQDIYDSKNVKPLNTDDDEHETKKRSGDDE